MPDGAIPILRFTQDIAAGGCRIIHGSYPRGTSCADIRESARRAGKGWGTTGSTGAYRDHVARGLTLCEGCRAAAALRGEYLPPRRNLTDAERAAWPEAAPTTRATE